MNLDCDHAQRVLQAAQEGGRPVITFSQKNERRTCTPARCASGQRHPVPGAHRRFQREFRLTMPGLFNVENALAAIAVCQGLNIPEQAVYVGLMKARVPGRMEVYSNADDTVTAIVDYAHNRMSFETLFRSVQAEYPGRRIVTVFGCPGKKALDRRKDLGEVAGANSDFIILTEEDSGEENTVSICREIAQYVSCDYSIEPNRGEAIRRPSCPARAPRCCSSPARGRRPGRSGAASISTPPLTWTMSTPISRSMTCPTVWTAWRRCAACSPSCPS